VTFFINVHDISKILHVIENPKKNFFVHFHLEGDLGVEFIVELMQQGQMTIYTN